MTATINREGELEVFTERLPKGITWQEARELVGEFDQLWHVMLDKDGQYIGKHGISNQEIPAWVDQERMYVGHDFSTGWLEIERNCDHPVRKARLRRERELLDLHHRRREIEESIKRLEEALAETDEQIRKF